MSEVLFGFLGVIIGAAVSLLGEQFTTRREREARQAAREQERKDRRDAFQREAILALQDALENFIKPVERVLAEQAASGTWTARDTGQPLIEYSEARWTINKLRARIFDPELRELSGKVQDEALDILRAKDKETMHVNADRAHKTHIQFDERVTVLLPDLF